MPTRSVLSGPLRLISFPGLLQVLSHERRSGRLALAVEGSAVGALWLEDGAVVHAEATPPAAGGARFEGTEALALLVGLDEGAFEFEAGPAPPRRTLAATTEHLLVEAACRRDTARRDEEGDLPPDAVPAFAPLEDASAGGPRLTTSQWRLLALVDGRRSVAEIARRSGLPVRAASCVLGELVEAGVLRLP